MMGSEVLEVMCLESVLVEFNRKGNGKSQIAKLFYNKKVQIQNIQHFILVLITEKIYTQ